MQQEEMLDVSPLAPPTPVALRGQRYVSILGAISVAVLCTAFTALYWNRFLSASAGSTFFFAAEQILKGRLPYRDFFFPVPPLQLAKTVLLIRLFGEYLAVPRFEGMVERVIVGTLLYFWLLRFCRPASAVLAAFFTVVQFASDPADSVESYHNSSVLWAICGGMCAGVCLEPISRGRERLAAAAAGFFCGLSLLTKQTTGAGTLFAVVVVVTLFKWRRGGSRAALKNLIALLSGLIVPIAAMLAWLWQTGSLSPFVHTLFSATTSKGSPVAVLTRPFLQIPWLFILVAALTPLLVRMVRTAPSGNPPGSLSTVILVSIACLLALGLSIAALFVQTLWAGFANSVVPTQMPILMLSITGSAYILFRYSRRFFRHELTESESQIWMMAAVSLTVAYMLSLSFAAYGPMAAPALALICGLALNKLEGSDRKGFGALAAVLMFLLCGSAAARLKTPFEWMHWPERNIFEATHSSVLPELAGLRLSQPTVDLVDTVTAVVKAHTKPGGSLVVYPYFPLFYSLTRLDPPTYPFNYYIDVCPDTVCRDAATSLLRHPPDAIIFLAENDEALARSESVFRSGARSGSRDVVAAIQELKPSYEKIFSSPIPDSSSTLDCGTSGCLLEVYARRQAP